MQNAECKMQNFMCNYLLRVGAVGDISQIIHYEYMREWGGKCRMQNAKCRILCVITYCERE